MMLGYSLCISYYEREPLLLINAFIFAYIIYRMYTRIRLRREKERHDKRIYEYQLKSRLLTTNSACRQLFPNKYLTDIIMEYYSPFINKE